MLHSSLQAHLLLTFFYTLSTRDYPPAAGVVRLMTANCRMSLSSTHVPLHGYDFVGTLTNPPHALTHHAYLPVPVQPHHVGFYSRCLT
jgi:hypothetical protein